MCGVLSTHPYVAEVLFQVRGGRRGDVGGWEKTANIFLRLCRNSPVLER